MAMSIDTQAVAGLLEATLGPQREGEYLFGDDVKYIPFKLTSSTAAEASLKQEESKPGFSLALLQIVAADTFPQSTRLASALFFKNFIRRSWVDEDGNYKLPQDEVTTIKSELIGLMVRVPLSIQKQLGDAISLIADSDFWQRWDTLVDDLVSRLTPDDAQVNNGVLQVAHSIFKRWEPLQRSDALYTEINHVLDSTLR